MAEQPFSGLWVRRAIFNGYPGRPYRTLGLQIHLAQQGVVDRSQIKLLVSESYQFGPDLFLFWELF
jgi:hypothetical protein